MLEAAKACVLAGGVGRTTFSEVARRAGVSRMTLRHALAELAQRGLVTRTVGRAGGTFVAEPKVEQDFTILAGFSEQLRRHGLVAGAKVLAAAEIAASPAASAALEIRVGAPVYEVRRLRLAGGLPILIEHSLFPAERCPGLLGYRLDGSLYELLDEKYGLRPHRAKESLEPVAAGVREAEALTVVIQTNQVENPPAGRAGGGPGRSGEVLLNGAPVAGNSVLRLGGGDVLEMRLPGGAGDLDLDLPPPDRLPPGRLAVISPATYVLTGVRQALLEGVSTFDLWGYIWPVLIMGAVLMPMGLWVFRQAETYAKRTGKLHRNG